MDRGTLLRIGGLVVGFFLLGQAARAVADGELVLAALGAVIGIAVLLTAFQFD
ncbi:hypothetical protein [Natronomonas gomsonensis]|uniref:hypothetical protein n=1 Tax=Natronomonas gomsonensis TaxID=1046043 RepID=UPI0015BA4826|nr:hypothetical protein [Natronomonas gomsonensis]